MLLSPGLLETSIAAITTHDHRTTDRQSLFANFKNGSSVLSEWYDKCCFWWFPAVYGWRSWTPAPSSWKYIQQSMHTYICVCMSVYKSSSTHWVKGGGRYCGWVVPQWLVRAGHWRMPPYSLNCAPQTPQAPHSRNWLRNTHCVCGLEHSRKRHKPRTHITKILTD